MYSKIQFVLKTTKLVWGGIFKIIFLITIQEIILTITVI